MNGSRGKAKSDKELDAIGIILEALGDLDGESIQRVIRYVLGRLSLPTPSELPIIQPSTVVGGSYPEESSVRKHQPSIRDLKDEKKPESANQMAALVAYYLGEVIQGDEAKSSVNTSDIEKYFKQAGFRLPKSLPQLLPNAAAAGYLEAVGGGLYRLNPVGYNLVAHGLPRPHKEAGGMPVRRRAPNTRR